MSSPRIIEPEPAGKCELCGAIEETRPYGPNEEEVCYACGQKDEAAVKRGIEKHIFGGGIERRHPKPLEPKEMN